MERSDPILEERQVESTACQSIQDAGEDWVGSLSVRVTVRFGMDS